MDKEFKLLFGKFLGEIYKLKNPDSYKDARVYGLLNGFEPEIDSVIEEIGFVSEDHINHVMDILQPYWDDKDKLKSLKGYYDIEPLLKSNNISRSQAIKILTYLRANNQFDEVIDKFDSSHSPVECKTFEIIDWDR